MDEILRAAYQAALSSTEWCIELLKSGDKTLHEALAKAEAYAEQLRVKLGLFSSGGDTVYGALSDDAKAEVDEQVRSIASGCESGE